MRRMFCRLQTLCSAYCLTMVVLRSSSSGWDSSWYESSCSSSLSSSLGGRLQSPVEENASRVRWEGKVAVELVAVVAGSEPLIVGRFRSRRSSTGTGSLVLVVVQGVAEGTGTHSTCCSQFIFKFKSSKLKMKNAKKANLL